MRLIRRRAQAQVIRGRKRHIPPRRQLTGRSRQVLPGADAQVRPRRHRGAVLGGGGMRAFAGPRAAVHGLRSRDVDVAGGRDAGGGTAAQHATGVVDVLPGIDGQAAGRLDARGAVDEVGTFGGRAQGALVAGDGALVGHVAADGGQAYVAPGDDAAGAVGEVVAGQQVQAAVGLHHAGIGQVVAGDGRQAAGGLEGAGVAQVAAGDDADVGALHQGAVRGQAVVGVGQVQHGHQHGLAVDDFALHPDDVVGQRGDLFAGQGGAYAQVQGLLGGDAVVHQVLELAGVAGLTVDVAGAGFGDDGLVDQGLFVEAVAQAFFAVVGVVAQGGQHVVRAHELLEVGERGVGFDQVFLWLRLGAGVGDALDAGEGGVAAAAVCLGGAADGPVGAAAGGRAGAGAAEAEQAVLAGGQAEAGQAQRVHCLLRQVRRQLGVERHAGGVGSACGRGVGAGAGAYVVVAGAYYAAVEVVLGGDVDGATGLDDGGVALVASGQLRGLGVLRQLVVRGGDEVAEGGVQATQVGRVIARTVDPVLLGELLGFVFPAATVFGALGHEYPEGLRVAGDDALVGEAVRTDGQILAGTDGAAGVVDLPGNDAQVAAGRDRGGSAAGGDRQLVAFGDFVHRVLFGAGAIGNIVVQVLVATDLDDLRGVLARIIHHQHRALVVQCADVEGHVAVALDRRRAVDDAVGQAALPVAVDAQVAQAVDVGVTVVQRRHAQAHVTAAEDQPLVVTEGAGGQDQAGAAAKGAFVVDAARGDGECSCRGQAPGVAQLAADVERGIGAALDAGRAAQAGLGSTQVQVTDAGQAAVAAVAAAQGQPQGAVAGDQAIVVPVAASAGEVAAAQ